MGDIDPILAERRGKQNGILWITLNRPEKMNALTFPLLRQLRDICVEARNDRSLRCMVITGAGRGFCAGMDMGGGANPDAPAPVDDHPDPEGRRLNFRHEVDAYVALRRLEIPVIAGINGPAVGAGFDLVCHCDLAVGSTAARFQVAYVRRGLYADLGGFWSIPKILGWRKAMDLMMTGRFMSAEEAHESGLTNFLVSPEEFEQKTMDYALEIEAGPPIGQKVGKMLAYRTASMDFEAAMAWSESVIPLVDMSQDFKEGVAAFREKRNAEFKGR
ncbi:MAG: enoyl-CoA hydratase/isomerase family protein [Proteobacteria bacterium]|jgi:enoyl-CoA hydratase/carnithine racemase|nr:enoyl-CoA hydratase/isomerase family protein [Pseudomonadota bacterium]MDA1302636.1 enoyl-CoA hydratase/isomerase family protein [Pseudomonadota bacterium]